ncbi:MAG TPA: hypothetical protein VKB80_26940 [Kofleriaceae bacterium]|nr:hypothetical protein [Kofleriaceae bacterium]
MRWRCAPAGAQGSWGNLMGFLLAGLGIQVEVGPLPTCPTATWRATS